MNVNVIFDHIKSNKLYETALVQPGLEILVLRTAKIHNIARDQVWNFTQANSEGLAEPAKWALLLEPSLLAILSYEDVDDGSDENYHLVDCACTCMPLRTRFNLKIFYSLAKTAGDYFSC